ncbi:MAG TPA: DUF5686 and carboxypeptidase regulatory-like domain-containing protein [Salinimicrobium sp.]|nr:DUF5686 and carboxypeptidase regulatory-like domain-containing protein [Salinimicrobium sp.]
MKYIISVILLFLGFSSFSQITGKVVSSEGEALPYVNIYLEDSFKGTTSNEKGNYELEISQPGNYTLIFQFLGFNTLKKEISVAEFPFTLNVVLSEETTTLEEVILVSDENPAHDIIAHAIEKRQFHKEKIEAYTADFYSRGLWRIKNVPEEILGMEVGDLGGSLDSTRSGIVYLSETISEITFKAPNDFKEKILASKVSGNDNGFSLNSAQEATISFYNNLVDLNSELVSPIADYAFNYYNFSLEGIFYTDGGKRINKIKVVPKRPNDKVFSGFVYIVHDTWQIYALELSTTGQAMRVPPIEKLTITQNFKYSEEEQLWVRISQTVTFEFGMFGVTGNGRFIAVYSNYDFNPEFSNKTFGNEILSFAPKANEKDSVFWESSRPVPLTSEEKSDYLKKDSIQEYRNSKVYLDSIDAVRNKFEIFNLLTGYTFSNSFKNWVLSFSSPLFNTHVNTVQGYNTSLAVNFRKNKTEHYNSAYWSVFSEIEYGFSGERFRILGGFQKKFNSISAPVLTISGGTTVKQINSREPITETINGIITNFFERNYLKLYDLLFAQISYKEELFNGFKFFTSVGAEKRSPLYNTRTTFWVDREDVELTSNNPLQPYNYNSAPFKEHNIITLELAASIDFNQKYISYPTGKFNIETGKTPSLLIFYEKGFASSIADYNFDHLQLGLKQQFNIGNKGEFGYNIKAGTFFDDEIVSYLDYRHFKGNQTHIGTSSNYLDRFNLLPYYALSTGKNYLEAHFEHNFEGFILGKIPLINRLNYSLVLGAHQLYTQDQKSYSEFSVGLDNLGFGKIRFLRLDYVISSFDGNLESGFIFGLEFLQAF